MQILLIVLAVLALAVGTFLFVNRPHTVVIDAAPPQDFPQRGFSHAAFESLLGRYVRDDGRVAYGDWHGSADDRRRLASYLAAVARYSPQSHPERFATTADALAYWMNAYNAAVIHSVLENWPLDSVTDVRAPFELVRGLGFFWRQRYLFGGEALSLYAVENDRIRKRHRDARIHFVLNCGSESCPVMRPELPDGDALEPYLRRAAQDFVSDPRNVQVDHARRELRLSAIFKWYRDDFLRDLKFRGLPAAGGLLDYIRSVAPESMQEELAAADGYEVRFAEYDWSVNAS